MSVTASKAAVRSAVEGHVVGWFDGDAGRMDCALHAEPVKRVAGSRAMTRTRLRRSARMT